MNFLQKSEIHVNSLRRSETVPNCIQGRKGKGAMDILMDAPNCHQSAHAGSSTSSKDRFLLNELLLFPTSRENGNSKLQSFLVPNHPCKGSSGIDLSPNKDSMSLYNMTSGTAATRAMVAPLTPVSMEKNNCGNLKEYIPREIIDLNSEIQIDPLEDCVPNGVQPSQVVASLNVETEANNLVNVDPSECFEREKQDTNLNRTLSQKPQRKKHRPKVIAEDKFAKTPKKIILETMENSRAKRTYVRKLKEDNPLQSPNKRKYTRKKKEVNPQPYPGCVLGEQNVTDQNNFCRNPSVKRSLNFDLNERQTKKLNTQVNAASEEVKNVLTTQIPPATHSLTNENVNEKVDNPLQSPVKRKYMRKKKEVDPQPYPGCLLGEQNITDMNIFFRNPSVKRYLNFDLNKRQTIELNTQVNEASEAVKDVLTSQIPPATHSSTNENVNEKVRAPKTPSQPQQLSRLELTKRKWREEFASLVLNMKSRKEGENLNGDDMEIVCPHTDRNKDKNVEDGLALSKGRKRDHSDVDDGCIHTNTNGALCPCDVMKKRKKEYKQSKVLSDSYYILSHTANSWRNVDNSQNSNRIFMNADGRKFSNHVLTVNYVKKDSAEIILSKTRLSSPEKSSIQDNTGCCQTPASKVVSESVSCGAKACAEALTAYQSKPKSSKRKRKDQSQFVSSTAEDTKIMELITESIASKLACLNINEVFENVMNEPGNALVPFVGGGVMVPYSGPPEVRKTKRPRAKVDLDVESERVWNLLMRKESDAGEGTDADIEKWWENERQIFLGRAASFTARMHLIQGNRKFSPWKGSVVDSVIGVFLTQNVSDHLSSSAFMSLAARFPIRSNSSNTATNVQTPAGPIVTETNIYDQNIPGIYDFNQQSNRELSYNTESSFSDREVGHHDSPDTVLGLTVTRCANKVEREEDKTWPVEDVVSLSYSNSFTSFTQLLNMANSRALYATNVMGNKGSDEYSGAIDWPTLLRSNEILNPPKEPDLKNPEPSNNNESRKKNKKSEAEKYDWDSLRRQVFENGFSTERSCDTMDSMDYNALRNADVSEISKAIRERGMNNVLAERIKAFLDRLARDHGSVDLEWLRHVSPDKAKEYLLSINGLGLKSVECIRLLTLHQLAFPVDTNVARISVRLGWVPLQPLPESLQLHLLEMYPMMENIQKYLWPRLYKLDQAMLYELHYQLITFGKVFCTKSKPNCNACPMRAECRHFASAYASARLALPGPEEKRIVNSNVPLCSEQRNAPITDTLPYPQLMEPTESQMKINSTRNYEPIIEEPTSPEPESVETTIHDIEDDYYNDIDEMPAIKLDFKEFAENLQSYMHENGMQIQDGNFSNALVAISREAASLPAPKLKNVSRLRTEHQVYELPDRHPLLDGLDNREPDDPCKYLLAIWSPGETADSTEAPKSCCDFLESGKICGVDTCFSCNSRREAESQTVRGTILIPCRTANRGSFPLNGTYFQVNEVFADHASSRYPIDVPREWIWKLKRRTVYFGTSIPSIFKGLSMDEIQQCFCRGYVCVRGFDRTTRAPKPLYARLHFPASKVTRTKKEAAAAAAVKPKEATSAENTEQKSKIVKLRQSKNSSKQIKMKQ